MLFRSRPMAPKRYKKPSMWQPAWSLFMGSRRNARQQLKDVKASVTPAMHETDTQSATRPTAFVPQVTTVWTELMYVVSVHTLALARPPTDFQVVSLPHVPGNNAHESSRSKRRKTTKKKTCEGEMCRVSCWRMSAPKLMKGIFEGGRWKRGQHPCLKPRNVCCHTRSEVAQRETL